MSEARFLKAIGEAIPGAAGYRDPAARRDTDVRMRGHVAEVIETLRARLDVLRAAAEEEGEDDMRDDLDRLDERMQRTIDALHAAEPEGAFFSRGDLPQAALDQVCAHDLALLGDVALLMRDMSSVKYEAIGNLTLRELEGTLAAIELKIANRRDVLEEAGRI